MPDSQEWEYQVWHDWGIHACGSCLVLPASPLHSAMPRRGTLVGML